MLGGLFTRWCCVLCVGVVVIIDLVVVMVLVLVCCVLSAFLCGSG